MNPSRWRAVNDLFHTLLERNPDDRHTTLTALETSDPELAREVRSLLASHDNCPGFLGAPVWEADPSLILDDGDSLVGRTIGTYRVLEEVGRGGMGVVYAAADERLGRTVALKALPAELAGDALRRARLTREARAAAALSHPAIATVFALEEIDGGLYIVSELVRGRTLRTELHDGPLPTDRLLPTLIDIAGALEAAHSLGIVHRDLKPENIVRRSDGHVKVLDFGLARWEATADAPSTTNLTEAGVALGTPGYMAPEQLSGGATDARTDIFAFGVLAWELATGEHPFGTDPTTVLARMTGLMEGRVGSLPRPAGGLERIALTCMRAAPAARYSSARELLQELHGLAAVGSAVEQGRAERSEAALWWWRFHQAIVATVDAATPALAVLLRQSVAAPYGRWIFLAVLAFATIAVTLRLNLLFISRVHAASLGSHRRRLLPYIAVAESLLSLVLLVAALTLGAESEVTAALLLSLALVLLASLTIIEPATTAAAGLDSKPRPDR